MECNLFCQDLHNSNQVQCKLLTQRFIFPSFTAKLQCVIICIFLFYNISRVFVWSYHAKVQIILIINPIGNGKSPKPLRFQRFLICQKNLLIRREVQVFIPSSKLRLWSASQWKFWWIISYRRRDIRTRFIYLMILISARSWVFCAWIREDIF